jgi:integration host factor subunit beta
MTKSELIERIARKQSHLGEGDVALAVHTILEQMTACLAADGGRIEIRGFGSFSLRFRPARVARNPRTGSAVALPARHAAYFKPGSKLRERVNREN